MTSDVKTAGEIAVIQLEKSVDAARREDNWEKLLGALTELGQAYLAEGNAPKALTQFEEGLEIAQKVGDKKWEGRMWGYRGICLMRLGNSHFAQIALYKSHNLAKELEDKPLLIDALSQLGTLQMDAGQSTKAISKLERALGHAVSIDDKPRIMHLAGKLGNLFQSLSLPDKAVEYYALALQAAEHMGQQHAVCSFKLSIGNAYLANEQYDTARELFEEGLNLAGELDNPQAELSALGSLMRTHIAVDNGSMAVLYGDHAIRLARTIGEPGAEIGNLNLLTAYLVEKGSYKKALPHLQRGVALATENQDWDWQLTMQERLGFVHYQLGQSAAAREAYEAALEPAMQLQDPAAAAQLYGRLSAAFAELDEMDHALKAAEQALKLGEEQEAWSLVGEQHILLAFTYAERDEISRAEAHCRKAVAAFEKTEDSERLEKAEALLEELSAAG